METNSMTAALLADALPSLPPYIYGRETSANERVFTADQMRAYALEALRTQAAALAEREWIAVSERLPELRQSVALLDTESWENVPGDWHRNVYACGYLDKYGGQLFWSIRGERARAIKAFTHWTPLAAAPSPNKEQTK